MTAKEKSLSQCNTEFSYWEGFWSLVFVFSFRYQGNGGDSHGKKTDFERELAVTVIRKRHG